MKIESIEGLWKTLKGEQVGREEREREREKEIWGCKEGKKKADTGSCPGL